MLWGARAHNVRLTGVGRCPRFCQPQQGFPAIFKLTFFLYY